jgi:uncharacterized repeat protein (TIGR01451 family)
MPGVFARLVRTIGFALALFATAAENGEASPAAGVVISNTVTAQYTDTHGLTYGAQSNTLRVSVAAVGAMVVSPKETAVDPAAEGYPAGTPVTRTFTITNTGNAADAYTIASVAPGPGTVTSIAFLTTTGNVPVSIGTTVSPQLLPGDSVRVQVIITTVGIAVGAAFPITLIARSTNAAVANGLVSDSGKEWAVAQAGAAIAGPLGPNTAINKLVDQVRTHTANPGETVTYSIAFKNYGGSPATNVAIVDDVPAGITAQTSTVALNAVNASAAATLAGQRLTVKIGTLAAGAVGTLTFDAVVQNGTIAGASFVNIASLTADGLAPVTTTPASVLVGLGNVVYDGYSGSGSPVNGAVLTLRDFHTKAIVALPSVTSQTQSSLLRSPLDVLIGVPAGGLAPNSANANPFTTGSDGTYSFVFAAGQLGSQSLAAQYELDISAPGYRDRRIEVSISPDASGLLYDATLVELDQMQLAAPGGFSLVTNSVSLSEVFGLLGNLPMFAPHPVAVSKTVDRDVASGGDRLLYTLQVGNSGAQLGATQVVDTLPAGVVYAPGTARVDGVPTEPQRNGRILTWNFPALTAQHTIVYACVVMPFTPEGSTLINVVDVSAQSGGAAVRASASADTRVVAGALGNRIVITGRVFVDAARTGRFRDGDHGLAGVRVYLEDGESVTTDNYGRFTFPSVHPGQHVLRVDATTLPAGVRPYDDRRYDSPRSLQRLLHGLYDAGLMHDVNFAVEPAA